MNIFYLSPDPTTCAAYHCDKHIVKMILEYAQLLSTAHHVLDEDRAPLGIYKCTHKNHPCAVWVREASGNYTWLVSLFLACLAEYTKRYGKVHATTRLVDSLLLPPMRIPTAPFAPPPQCMPDVYKRPDTVQSYHAYYVGAKSVIAEWHHGPAPVWYTAALYAAA
jgi:hypothetical protein